MRRSSPQRTDLDDTHIGLARREFRGQPALADTRVADDGTSRAARDAPRRRYGLQPAHLVGPADERGSVGGFGLAAEPLVHRTGAVRPLTCTWPSDS